MVVVVLAVSHRGFQATWMLVVVGGHLSAIPLYQAIFSLLDLMKEGSGFSIWRPLLSLTVHRSLPRSDGP